MKKWEYKTLYLGTEKNLNILGKEGWELVGYAEKSWFIFKRPLIDPPVVKVKKKSQR